MNSRFEQLLSAMQLFSEGTEQLSDLIIKVAVAVALFVHVLKLAARILRVR